MTSNISTSLFKKRLEYRTKNGYPFYMGPFQLLSLFLNQTTHTFIGAFDDLHFQLSNNSFYRIPFVIVGTYKENEVGKTVVKYEMKTNYYSFFWIHLITVLILLVNLEFILRLGSSALTLINVLIILISFCRYIAIYHKKKEFEENFIEIFEITYNKY
ncbi:hypothetical protein [Flavobacterium johnsoniae]|uniref:Uncharacterized protein n=1 Tax=Flavobacterium johnsoniae TaxID=986 RepID=A0A1M5RZT3_FLAJO|nr:hypothetical protein [Flavobacterium johnsoniae]SHH31729.1 hypothetical protein SAMN05444388_10972 [Flavobacterium johnsoniae]